MRIDAHVQSRTENTIVSLHRLMQNKSSDRDKIITSVSLVESMVTEYLDDLVASSGVSATPLGQKLLEKNLDVIHQSWERRHEWLKWGFGVEISGSSEWQRLQTVNHVRNAIIHGDGVLTRKQGNNVLAAVDMRRKVKDALDADIQGRRVILRETSGRRAIVIAMDYALKFDHTVSDAGLLLEQSRGD